MAVETRDLQPMMQERRENASRVVDEWGTRKDSYQEWRAQQDTLHKIARGDWHMVWPDRTVERATQKIPNYVVLAAEHRARLLSDNMPMLSTRPKDLTDKSKMNAEKRERVVKGWWDYNNVDLNLALWAIDLQFSGISVLKALPHFENPIEERFPCFQRVDPRTVLPSPFYAKGPFLDDCMIVTEENVRTVQNTYGQDLAPMMTRAGRQAAIEAQRVRIIEYHSDTQTLVAVEPIYRGSSPKIREMLTLVDEQHGIGRCPIVIGARASFDGVYRGDFTGVTAMMNTANRLMTLHIDSAIRNVYPVLIVGEGVENPDDYGPGAQIRVTDNGARLEYLSSPPSPYDGYQIMRNMDAAIRTAVLLPPSVTGDPNESVTSAAGIGATQTMPNAEVAAMQREAIAPMLQAANEVAIRGDEVWSDVEKTITGVNKGASFAETYTPSKDFKGNYNTYVNYGIGAGQDKVTLNVALLQNKGEGMISDREAREMSPYVRDPMATEKQIASEQMTKAAFSALIAGAAAPPGDPRALTLDQISAIWDALESPDGGLKAAIKEHLTEQQQALAPVPETGPPALASPGVAGAGEPQPQQPPSFEGAPPLEALLGG